MALQNETMRDSPRGVALLVGLNDTQHKTWSQASETASMEPYPAYRWEECYVIAGGKRPTTIVAQAAVGVDPRLFDLADPVYRTATTLLLSDEDPFAPYWRRLAWQLLPAETRLDEAHNALRRANVESQQRQFEQHQIDDYTQREKSLSSDERTVLEAVCSGKLNKQIAAELGVSIRTVEQRRRRVFSKMGVESAVPLAELTTLVRTLTSRVYRTDPPQSLQGPSGPRSPTNSPIRLDDQGAQGGMPAPY